MPFLTTHELKNDLEKGNSLNVYVSDRAGRKTSVVQEFMIDECLKGNPFVLIRTKIDEHITQSWFSEYVLTIFEKMGIEVFFEKIDNYIVALKLKKDEQFYTYCYGLYLSVAEKYKSNFYAGFQNVKYVVWEECVPNRPQVQNIEYCREKYFDDLKRVLSIGSTVSRYNPVQYIFLGNDISDNIVNSITVSFDLLERLSANCEIIDNCEIDGRQYSYLFKYFDFPGAVNHWIENSKKEISASVDIQKAKKMPYLLYSKYGCYKIYKVNNFLYVSRKKLSTAPLETEKEFFKRHNCEHLLKNFQIDTALLLLNSFHKVSYNEIASYYGENWDFKDKPVFKNPERMVENSVINIDEVCTMKNADLYNLPNYATICGLLDVFNTRVVYENIGIKFKIQSLLITLKTLNK